MADEPNDWSPELDELSWRTEAAMGLGGSDAVARQHAQGKLTARERIAALLDDGTFREIGVLTGSATYGEDGRPKEVTPSNSVTGKGKMGGRLVAVAADDYTVRAGSSEASNSGKWTYLERWALQHRRPLVRLVDAAGGSIRLLEKNATSKVPGYADWPMAELLGMVPVVGVALGPCAGLGAVKVVSSHFSVMARETSQVFAAGPHVVAPGTGQELTKEELGGYRVHTRGSGVVDNDATDERDAFEQARRFLSYLPSSAFELAPRNECGDPVDRCEDELRSIVPRDRRQVYRMRKILELVFDEGSVFEIGRHNGPSAVTAFARLDGYPVGVLATDPYRVAGAVTTRSAEKTVRFIDLCDTFHLPIVNLVDQPGLHVGADAEAAGTVRAAVRWRQAIAQSIVPWCPVFVRRAFGVGGGGYGPFDQTEPRLAWPSAYWGSLPVEGGVQAAFRRDIASAPDPELRKQELFAYYRRFESPFRAAERFLMEEIVDPRETRPLLCEFAAEAYERLPERLGVTRRTMRS